MLYLVIIIEEFFHKITFIYKFSILGPKKHDWITFMYVFSVFGLNIF